MGERSNRQEVRNPVLALPSVQRLMAMPPEHQVAIRDVLSDLVIDARQRADRSWKQNKGPMAAYWKAVGAYALHLRNALSRSLRQPKPTSPRIDFGGGHGRDGSGGIAK